MTPELKAWLTERLENCLRIARQKTGADKAGWMEDARFFQATIAALTPEPTGTREETDRGHMTLTREQIEAFRAFLMREYVEPGPRWAKDEAHVHALCNAALRSLSVPEPTETIEKLERQSIQPTEPGTLLTGYRLGTTVPPLSAPSGQTRATGKYRLVYNKETKRIDKVRNFDGLAVESFEPPEGGV